jgi:alpha-D-ribose 1-methylphosphonate 5-phosphate C-P lyase
LDGGSAVNSVTKNAALSGTIKAGSQVVIEGTAMPTFLGTARGFVVFTVAGTNDVVNGIYQITNIATGAISNTNLVRPVSAYGTQP